MKKLFLLAAALIMLGLAPLHAQTATPAAPKPTTTKMTKDGKPDKRFKENKQAASKPAAGPTKKDGTPDMRYKSNKAAAGVKK